MVSFRNLSTLADKAKEAVEKRGGTDALKQDAEQLKSIAKGPGTLSEKAKAAAAALKEGGAERQAETAGAAEAPTSATAPKAKPPA